MSNLSSARAAITQSALTVTSKPLDALRPSDRLLRRHSKRQIKQLARSIETFGFNVPILVDRDNTIIAGQARYLACRELAWTEIPVICVGHLNEAQLKAFMIADNRLSELSTWDDQILGETLQELDPLYVDTIIRRWQAMTGGTARHAVTGVAFNDSPVTPVDSDPDALNPGEQARAREPAVRRATRKGGVR